MKLIRIFQLEFGYQLRQYSTWILFALLFGLSFLSIIGNYVYDARDGYFLLNAPIVIASVTAVCCLFWLLMGAFVAGDAAARDLHTQMFPLTYTAPASKAEYLGGRFMAALFLNLLLLLAIPGGLLMAIYFTGVEPEILGPFRLAAYLKPYLFLVLPNVFFTTAIQFSIAAVKRNAMAAYLGGAIFFFLAYPLWQIFDGSQRGLASLADPLYFTTVLNYLDEWSPIERNTRLMQLQGTFLLNRLLWFFLSMCILAFTHYRFRFTNHFGGKLEKHRAYRPTSEMPASWQKLGQTASLPTLQGVFSFATQIYQLGFITIRMFRTIAKNQSGLPLLVGIALVVAFALPGELKAKGVPLLPRTDQVLHLLAAPIAQPGKFWIIIYVLTIFYAGDLVWRERESGLSELSNAAPVPEWVLFLSRFFSLAFLLVTWLIFLLLAGILVQLAIGGATIDIGLYFKVLFGFQLVECLLFAILALFVHVMINQKYLGHLVAFVAAGCIVFAPTLGIEHKLLIFGSGPAWTYTDMVGFGPSVGPWLWIKSYWVAWGLLMVVVARLTWVRSRDESLKARLHLAYRRLTPNTLRTISLVAGLIFTLASYVFFNTNILHNYATAPEIAAGRAEYEHRYGRYRNLPQPQLNHVNLQVEIYPELRELEIKGRYVLVNNQSKAIDSVHLAMPAGAEIRSLIFSRPITQIGGDKELRFLLYFLKSPLQPGDTLTLDFNLYHKALGFTNGGAESVVAEKFTQIRNSEWLPVIGYQQYRELDDMGLRKKYRLAPRLATASLYNVNARNYAPFAEHVTVDAVVGTGENQTVVGPGNLRKTWRKGRRRYFHYITDAPIRNEYSFLSANYAVHVATWTPRQYQGDPVEIQIFHNAGNAENLERMMRSAQASLRNYTMRFGPYPHRQLRFVATPGYSGGNHAAPINITAEEGFFLLNPAQDPRGFDLVTAVVAHEIAHQWWGNQLKSADVEGAGLLSESLAWYSAMGVLEECYGPEHLKKLLSFLREEYETPRSRAAVPLLRATDFYQYYRKGPFALYALSEYIGRNRVDEGLRRLLTKHLPGKTPMATSLNLYEELQTVTPDSLRYLLHDIFVENTFWDLQAKEATIKQTKVGTWQVKFNLSARKQVVNEMGLEKEVGMKDWVEIGVFAPAKNNSEPGKLLYLQKHFLDANQHTIIITVPSKPSHAGIDPNYLLIDWNTKDNFIPVKMSPVD